jgi:hypothetical protein
MVNQVCLSQGTTIFIRLQDIAKISVDIAKEITQELYDCSKTMFDERPDKNNYPANGFPFPADDISTLCFDQDQDAWRDEEDNLRYHENEEPNITRCVDFDDILGFIVAVPDFSFKVPIGLDRSTTSRNGHGQLLMGNSKPGFEYFPNNTRTTIFEEETFWNPTYDVAIYKDAGLQYVRGSAFKTIQDGFELVLGEKP